MKISLNWLKTYLDLDLAPEKVGEMLTSIGLEVEGLETVESIPGGLAGVVVGHVLDCTRHPDADRLSLTRVDIGSGEPLPIVCGAPNVAKGQKVLVATVGTTLHPLEGEPFTIKIGKIRGQESHGMICAQDELGMGHDHSGILVLPTDTPVGMPARDYLGLETDHVFDVNLTPNRSDATGHFGVARDLYATLRINHHYQDPIRTPDVSAFRVDDRSLPIEVVVENPEACPRYSGLTIRGVRVGESPEWLRRRLAAIGIRSINNVVDATNFVLHELGQPLHAFDAAHISHQRIVVKTLPEGTRFRSLDDVERTLFGEDLMICDGASRGLCIGGVFGGAHSGVTETTTDVFLESAHFNPKWIRRSSMRHNLRTEAARCFEKGSDPNITVYALKRAALLICELAGGRVASDIVDLYPAPVTPKEIDISHDRVNRLIGVQLSATELRTILSALDMAVLHENEGSLRIAVPTNKADVTREADVIEEILRIYGFDKVPMPAHIRSAMVFSEQPDPRKAADTIANYLAANGFHEMMAVSLTQSKYYTEHFTTLQDRLVYINNTSNVQLDVMRPSMLFSGLEAIAHNQNRQNTDLRLFEFGKIYESDGEQYREDDRLSLFLTGKRHPESWLADDKARVSFYTLKSCLNNVLHRLGVTNYQQTDLGQDETFLFGTRYHRGEQVLALFGMVQPRLQKAADIKQPVYFADIWWNNVIRAFKKQRIEYSELNRFPAVRRDLALVLDQQIGFGQIAAIAQKTAKKLLRDVNLFDVYENEQQLGPGKKSYAVSFVFEDPGRTMKDEETDKLLQTLMTQYEQQLGAVIRK